MKKTLTNKNMPELILVEHLQWISTSATQCISGKQVNREIKDGSLRKHAGEMQIDWF